MSHIVPLLLLLAIIVAASKTTGHVSTLLGQPAVFGEILVGVILGPGVLDILHWPLFVPAVAEGGTLGLGVVVHDLAEIGGVLLMFVAGMETDPADLRRVSQVAFWTALGGVVLPLGAGALSTHLLGHDWSAAVFIGATLTATSVSISAQVLMELDSLRSRVGSTILAAAIIDDVLGVIILSIVVAFNPLEAADSTRSLLPGLGMVLLRMTLFLSTAWYFGRVLFERMLGLVSRWCVSTPVLSSVLVVALLYAWGAEHFGGIAAITGSYLAGLLFARTTYRSSVLAMVKPLTYSLFVPVFFVSIGLHQCSVKAADLIACRRR